MAGSVAPSPVGLCPRRGGAFSHVATVAYTWLQTSAWQRCVAQRTEPPDSCSLSARLRVRLRLISVWGAPAGGCSGCFPPPRPGTGVTAGPRERRPRTYLSESVWSESVARRSPREGHSSSSESSSGPPAPTGSRARWLRSGDRSRDSGIENKDDVHRRRSRYHAGPGKSGLSCRDAAGPPPAGRDPAVRRSRRT
jgi:hypothetical protein